jgi:hypothetical protein
LVYSCSNNSNQINGYKNKITSNFITKTQDESKITTASLEKIKIDDETKYTPTAIVKIDALILFKDSINSVILGLDSITDKNVNQIKNRLLFRFSTYKEGNKNWSLDTNNYLLNNCNPRDTMIISRTNNQFDLISNSNSSNSKLKKARMLQLSQNIFIDWKNKFDRVVFRCFGPVPETILLSNNNILYQNEISYIYPNIFVTGFSESIHIFKENSDDFIMEHGEKKVFTNPITLKASSKKGVHTVKGLIYIKQKGELVPKPFEFRYIVE